eukprot:Opistho-2@16148
MTDLELLGFRHAAAATKADASSRVGAVVWPDVELDKDGYIEYRKGSLNSPIVITMPHGGDLKPSSVKTRTKGVVMEDFATIKVGVAMAEKLYALTGELPHVVINHLHRSKLDCNRAIVEATEDDDRAKEAYNEYHAHVLTACEMATDASIRVSPAGTAQWSILFDVHGHNHKVQRVEIGFALKGDKLRLPDAELLALGPSSTVRHLVARGNDFLTLLRGTNSLGALLEKKGYKCVPSPSEHFPTADEAYFSGGYTSIRYSKISTAHATDCIQLEHPPTIRKKGDAVIKTYAAAFGPCALKFIKAWYGVDLEKKKVAVDACASCTLSALPEYSQVCAGPTHSTSGDGASKHPAHSIIVVPVACAGTKSAVHREKKVWAVLLPVLFFLGCAAFTLIFRPEFLRGELKHRLH